MSVYAVDMTCTTHGPFNCFIKRINSFHCETFVFVTKNEILNSLSHKVMHKKTIRDKVVVAELFTKVLLRTSDVCKLVFDLQIQ